MTLTIELPADVTDLLLGLSEEKRGYFTGRAEAEAVAALRRNIEADEEADLIAALKRGLADVEAGRTHSFEQCQAKWAAERAERRAKRAGA